MPVTFTNKEEIANRALQKIGAASLASFDDETPQANAVKAIYKSLIQNLLTKGNWHFCTKKQQLTRLDETPVNEWTYSYEIPTDLLNLRSLYNAGQVSVVSVMDYEVFEQRRIYSDESELYADYITYTDESYWPYYFVEFVIAALASELAFPITRSTDLATYYMQIAYGPPQDNGSGGLLGEALRRDGQMSPPESLRLTYLTNPRFEY